MKNPLDPSEGTTGHTMMALTEVYRGLEGSQAHMESSAGLAGHWSHAGEGDRQLFGRNDHAR